MLMADADMVPIQGTDEILETPADIAACRCIGKSGRESHGEDGVVSEAFLRVSRKALEAIGPPWFTYTLSDDGQSVAVCTGRSFCERARNAGFAPTHVGKVGHLIPMVVVPGREGKVLAMPPGAFIERHGLPSPGLEGAQQDPGTPQGHHRAPKQAAMRPEPSLDG